MGYFNTRGLRGSELEEFINLTNQKYREVGLGLVQKIPTPIKPVELDPINRNIKKAYFEERSTVDYIGLVQGVPICFDAKETSAKSFPLKNIHKHQIEFMKDFNINEGVSFFIIYFRDFEKTYLVPYEFIIEKIRVSENGGRKSIPYEEISQLYEIKNENGFIVHYIKALDSYIQDLD